MRLGVKSMRALVRIDTNTVNILEKTNNSENDPLQWTFVRNLIVEVSNYDVHLIIKYLAVGFKSMKWER